MTLEQTLKQETVSCIAQTPSNDTYSSQPDLEYLVAFGTYNGSFHIFDFANKLNGNPVSRAGHGRILKEIVTAVAWDLDQPRLFLGTQLGNIYSFALELQGKPKLEMES